MTNELLLAAAIDNYYVQTKIEALASSFSAHCVIGTDTDQLVSVLTESAGIETILLVDFTARVFDPTQTMRRFLKAAPGATPIGCGPALSAELVRRSKISGARHILPYDTVEELLREVLEHRQSAAKKPRVRNQVPNS